MTHDILAELRGYRDELAAAEANGRDEHAARVREAIKPVAAAVRQRAEQYETGAEALQVAGQDAAAKELAADAARYRDALGADFETADDTTTRERATTRKAGK